MDPFHLLSRGGVQFDKKKFKSDVELFTGKAQQGKNKGAAASDLQGDLPTELDFFKYAQGGPKRKSKNVVEDSRSPKKRKTSQADDEDVEMGSVQAEDQEDVPTAVKHRVTAKGKNIPAAAETFEDMAERYNLSPLLQRNLASSGYKQPTAIQMHGVPIILESRDLAAISPTGTGKTLAYLLPIMASLSSPASSASGDSVGLGVRAVILAPTKELAHQIHNECLKLAQGRKWRTILFSKATASTLADKAVRDKVDIIVSTPLRLVASLQSGALDLSNVRHLVLDEADRMLDAEFLEQVQEVVAACTHESVQKAVFSATLPANAEKVALGMLRDPIRLVVGLKDTPLPLIAQALTYVADDASKLPTLLAYLARPHNPPVLVFAGTQPRAASLAEELVLAGVQHVDCLHAGMTHQQREDALARMRAGESWVMVSTEVMARGMDFKGVREVVNYDFPTSVQSYVHRVGRTGRAGREGKAVTFFTNDDAPYLKTIANIILQSGSTVPEWILKLPKPSKLKRRQMGKVKRSENVNSAARIGRAQAIKKRDMIAGSKRRKVKGETALVSRVEADDE